jgi:hypothetical protein
MTAVEKLEAMVETKLSQPMSANFKELFDQAKEIEKQQIKDAWLSAWKDSMINPLADKYYEPEAEQYYNETFKNR